MRIIKNMHQEIQQVMWQSMLRSQGVSHLEIDQIMGRLSDKSRIVIIMIGLHLKFNRLIDPCFSNIVLGDFSLSLLRECQEFNRTQWDLAKDLSHTKVSLFLQTEGLVVFSLSNHLRHICLEMDIGLTLRLRMRMAGPRP